jgi:hypothetical protein
MKQYCENSLCLNEAVKEVPVSVRKPADQTRAVCAACQEVYSWGVQHGRMSAAGLLIAPPPEEKRQQPMFRVVYVIDVNADDVREAAESTHRIMTDPESLRPVLQVIDSKGTTTQIDLSEEDAGSRDKEKTANYEAAAQYLADQGKRLFTGPMKAGLWNGRCMDASVMSKNQGEKTAYAFLIKFGDQYASSLSADLQRQWQNIKEQAASILANGRENTC